MLDYTKTKHLSIMETIKFKDAEYTISSAHASPRVFPQIPKFATIPEILSNMYNSQDATGSPRCEFARAGGQNHLITMYFPNFNLVKAISGVYHGFPCVIEQRTGIADSCDSESNSVLSRIIYAVNWLQYCRENSYPRCGYRSTFLVSGKVYKIVVSDPAYDSSEF